MTAKFENIAGSDYILLEFFVQPGMDDILMEPEAASDLVNWSTIRDDFTYLGEERSTDGIRAIRRFRSNTPMAGSLTWFARLRVTPR